MSRTKSSFRYFFNIVSHGQNMNGIGALSTVCICMCFEVVQLGGPARKKKFERIFKPPYDIWKLFDDSSFDHARDQRKKNPYHHGDLKNMFSHTQNFFGQQAVAAA